MAKTLQRLYVSEYAKVPSGVVDCGRMLSHKWAILCSALPNAELSPGLPEVRTE
ncbi:MAG: hypothetical protein AAGD09_26670 [Cyanobacteria bacterium P01_F01_bin.56]